MIIRYLQNGGLAGNFSGMSKIISVVVLSVILISCGGGGDSKPSSTDSVPGDQDGQDVPGGGDSSNPDSPPGGGLIPGSDEDPDNADVLTGTLVDSAVVGISYSTPTQSGETNANGEFFYQSGELVTFSLGSLQLPQVLGAQQVTPIEMAEGSPDPHATITNIARLLQSLDQDGDPANGIVISPQAAAAASPIDFTVTIEAFEVNPDVINLVANSGSVTTELISAYDANQHLAQTLGDDTIPGS